MNAQSVACECGARLKIPPELAKARSVKCPKCAAPVDISGLTWPAAGPTPAPSTPVPPPTAGPAAPRSVAAEMIDEAIGAPTTKNCPFCGEKVLAEALKCRHCGEFFEASKAPARAAKARDADEPNPAEYFVATVLFPVGLIIGVIWAVQKQAKAKRMLQASGLCSSIALVAALMARIYLFGEPTGPVAPSVPEGAQRPYYVVVPEQGPSGPPQGPQSRPADLPGAVDLEGQPPHIQRAMRANVRIESPRSMGSGVVIQRLGDGVLILTNHHVVTESTDLLEKKDVKTLPRLRITYFNEQSNPGTVVWIAPDGIDLALVKAAAPGEIEPVSWAAAARVMAGQEVFAVGNPIGLGWTFTKGVVSALRQQKHGHRDIGIIQNDTKTTFGNSGGGLYNAAGELIGINSTIADPRLGGGLSFAIRPQILGDLKPEGLTLPAKGP